MTNILTLLQEVGIEPRRVSGTNGGEYHSSCSLCGDGGKGRDSDRFHCWPERENKNGLCRGAFWCRQCGERGDTIALYMKMHGCDFISACDSLGIILPQHGSHQGHRRAATPAPPVVRVHNPKVYADPSDLWQECAAAFLADCEERLASRSDAAEYLSRRGLTKQLQRRWRLGYNESSKGGDRYRRRERWGLPPKQRRGGSSSDRLWLPRGWVIPLLSPDGARVVQLRIRRHEDDIARFASDIKYLVVDGSSHSTMVLEPEAEVFVIVESGFDAMLVAGQFAGGSVGAVSTWNSSARPDERATAILHSAERILNALDYDQAGAKEQAWWRANFRRMVRWPVGSGKDPGEAFEAGDDLRRWVLDGVGSGLSGRIEARERLVLAGQPHPERQPRALRLSEPVEARIEEEGRTIAAQACPVPTDELPADHALRWCPLCYGDRFFAASGGGRFCVVCQPDAMAGRDGRYVRAMVPRQPHVVV